jgi:hypothetical protein
MPGDACVGYLGDGRFGTDRQRSAGNPRPVHCNDIDHQPRRSGLPTLFVMLWSTGFIDARASLPNAGPLIFLALRFGIALGWSRWPHEHAGHAGRLRSVTTR